MVQPAVRHNYQVIDLTSDDENDEFMDDEVAWHDAPSIGEPTDDEGDLDADNFRAYGHADVGNREIIDLTAIPDVDVPPSDFSPHVIENAEPTDDRAAVGLITEATCLQLVLDVFPDVSVDHVLTMIKERTTDLTRSKRDSERIVNELLEGTYPKEADMASKKRKREDSEEVSDYEKDECEPGVLNYETDALDLLKDEFLNVPARHIINTFKQHKTLFKAYTILEEQVRKYQQTTRTFVNPPRPRNKRGTELVLIERGSRLPKELRAAKKKVEIEAGKRRKMEETKRAEEVNLRQAKMNNQMGECQCCFTEYPLNRMISCSDKVMHLFCMDCPKKYIETEMGQSKCRPVCFASTECKGTFSRQQLQQVLSDKTFERLEHMQQQQDLAAAGLDFLSECPFCDFKAECPPVDVDREFRCQSTKCGKTSCRLCNKETHIPLSCEEAKKDGQLTLRHVVEEAMSAALIRKCNNCQRPFVKDYGCNKMCCSHCGNKQCYICSKNVDNYEHFGDPNRGRCALHDNVEDVHEQAVKQAADEAMAQVRAENPDLSDADLMVQVSDRVKQAETARRGRAAERLNEFPYEMVGHRLAHRPGFPGGAPLPPRAVVRPPPRPLGRIGDALEAVYNEFAAAVRLPNAPRNPDPVAARHAQALQQLEAQAQALLRPQPQPQPQLQVRAHQHFQDAINPLAPIDPDFQAAQNRFQRQLREANDRAYNANRARDAQGIQAQMDRMNAERGERRRRMQDLQQRVGELRRLRGHRLNMAQAEVPAFGLDGPLANAGDAQAGAGVGGGLAFGGLDANRAIRMRELNNWFEEQLRNVPRQ